MDQATLIFPDTRPPLAARAATPAAVRLALFAAWLAIAGWLVAGHVFWRDEVRAFSLALSGGGLIDMAKAVHGEGHPLLWYALLRVAHMVVPVREVLPAVAFAVGAAGAAFVAWRAPFRPLILAAVLLGGWMTFEYAVMARNYGISMLLTVVIADCFARRRDAGRGGALVIGGLLFLLANTNVPSVILAGGFLLFWLVEIVAADGVRWSAALARWAGAAALALAGVVACFLTVYPPFNEAAVSSLSSQFSPGLALAAVLNVGAPFSELWPEPWRALPLAPVLLAAMVIAGPFSLLRRPAGAIAAAAVLAGLLLFFQFIYPGGYRHQALYLCFLVALHWMAAAGRGGRWGAGATLPRGVVPRVAGALVAALLALQVATTALIASDRLAGRVEGQSLALSRLLARPALRHAIVIADPDVLVEPLPYYATNPTFLVRQQRFGAVAHFTRKAIVHLTLGDLLATARRLQAATRRPVVILMIPKLDLSPGEHRWDEGMLGDTVARPGDMARFAAATQRIETPVTLARHGGLDEAYDAYLLRPVTAS